MKKVFFIGLICASLTGCVAKLTEEQIKNADYGVEPVNYEAVIKGYYENVAKDPDSLKYKEITKPRKGWVNDFGTYKFGYAVCATINGKNSYGAYVGYKTDYVLIRNDVVIHTINNVVEHNRIWGTRFCL